MPTLLYSHPAFLDHDTGPHHPESPDRLRAILAALDEPPFDGIERREPPRATTEQLVRVHAGGYVERLLENIPESGSAALDADTVVSPGSGEAALRAAGALCAAVDAALAADDLRAFCAVRPPGHHAEPARAMGFCLFNNIAVGAAHARAAHGLDRVAIVDFDVHHGNGSQTMFAADPTVMVAGSHQMPLYPGSGAAAETGVGNIVNLPLPPNADGAAFRAAWTDRGLPALRAFDPQLIMISAGFDGHAEDPLAQLQLREDDYAWLTGELVALAGDCCRGRVISTLEGGYNLDALARSVQAHVGALMEGG